MADNKDKQEDLKIPEKKIPSIENVEHFDWQKERGPRGTPEKKEILSEDKIVSDELEREIEMLKLDPTTEKEAEKEKEKIEYLGEKEKIEHLLKMVREKGVVFAVEVARKMNEPYLLDTLHDVLAREGFYLKFSKPSDDDKKT